MQLDYKILWDECLTVIKDVVPESAFKTWFLPIVPLACEDKKVIIQVPTQFFYEYIEEHYVDLLKKTIRKELGPDAKLEYSIPVGKKNGTIIPSSDTANEFSYRITKKL